jgi:hypothetical protein
MNQTPGVAKSQEQAPSVETLKIRECSFSFRAFFERPRPLSSVNTTELADAFLETFRDQNLSAADITLEKGDSLFGYSFKAHLYTRLVSITLGAIAVEGAFLRLLAIADRRIAAECIKRLVELFRPELSQSCFFEAAIHADFSSLKAREEFFSRNAHAGLEVGGLLGYKKLGNQQLIRVQIDQSFTYGDGAFILFSTVGMTLETFLSSDPIWRRYFELIERFGLRLEDV